MKIPMLKSVIITVILSQKPKKGDLIYGVHRKCDCPAGKRRGTCRQKSAPKPVKFSLPACGSRYRKKKKGHRAFDIARVSPLFLSIQPEISLFSFRNVMVAVPSLPVIPPSPAGPAASAGPVMPAGSVAPVAPVEPETPAEPVCPVEPVAPAGPAGPRAPSAPVIPAGTRIPVTPTGPAGPPGPVGPGGSGGQYGGHGFGGGHGAGHGFCEGLLQQPRFPPLKNPNMIDQLPFFCGQTILLQFAVSGKEQILKQQHSASALFYAGMKEIAIPPMLFTRQS